MTLYLSRLTLRNDPQSRALSSLIDPPERAHSQGRGQILDAHHRLVWSAFADGPDRIRDFLWRSEGQGRFMTLSKRKPLESPLFETPEILPFEPALSEGDNLGFALRVNATKDRSRVEGGNRRVDVVMDALHNLPGREDINRPRAAARLELATEAGTEWMTRQGKVHGFEPLETTVEDYRVMALPGHRGRRKGQPQFGILDITGVLKVTDPTRFVSRLGEGFGRAKAFGCGLMLIRRV
ncbi:type I-E CRISPR-associated protein Cas6/Cse3/CasE [Planktotalea arctica]|uniref:type I-E CRISPR-associated protein Cas6/Cse3/CasE n=1 Tax=Planktotalea arctica TaxID=1481893 RepID=UPI003219E193